MIRTLIVFLIIVLPVSKVSAQVFSNTSALIASTDMGRASSRPSGLCFGKIQKATSTFAPTPQPVTHFDEIVPPLFVELDVEFEPDPMDAFLETDQYIQNIFSKFIVFVLRPILFVALCVQLYRIKCEYARLNKQKK
jgi:hypothetical protein